MATRKSAAVVIAPPKPANEEARLSILRKLSILDTGNDEVFDAITRSVKRFINVPIVLVSLIDENRQWFKSCIGLPISETSRDVAFCAYAILSGTPELLIIPDAKSDERFANNPLVTGDPFIRFYAGAPLISSDGFALGTLCVIDRTPRLLNEEETLFLKDVAVVVVRAMELRSIAEKFGAHVDNTNADLKIVLDDRKRLLGIINTFSEAFIMWNENQQVVFVNDAFTHITGIARETALQFNGPDLFVCSSTEPATISKLQRAFGAREPVSVELVSQKIDGKLYWNCLSVVPKFDEQAKFKGYYGTFTDQSQRKAVEMTLEKQGQN